MGRPARPGSSEPGAELDADGLPRVALLAWLVIAAAFACWRIPFHDEWFSITLACDTTWPRFSASLAADVHPPWVAWLDRAVITAGAGRHGLALVHLLASFVGIVVLRRVVATVWPSVSPLWLSIAAFHPVVLMYAGATRWYSFALLADALRAWAIWGSPRSPRRVAFGFVAGSALGVAAGYGEVVLVAIDCVWLFVRGRGSHGRSGKAGIACVVVLAALAAAGTCLVAAAPLASLFAARAGSFSSSALVSWAALGPLGEAFLPWPWTLLVLLAIPGFALAMTRALTRADTRPFFLWIASTGLGWAVLTAAGVAHPRYSLALWYLVACALGIPFAESGLARAAAFATAAYLGLDLGLTLRARDFPFADENELQAANCTALLSSPEADVLVTAYARTQLELERACRPSSPVVAANFIHHYLDDPGGETAPIRTALARARLVDFVSVNVSSSDGAGIAQTNDDVRAVLAEQCKLEQSHPAVLVPHYALKAFFKPSVQPWHYTTERWRCR